MFAILFVDLVIRFLDTVKKFFAVIFHVISCDFFACSFVGVGFREMLLDALLDTVISVHNTWS